MATVHHRWDKSGRTETLGPDCVPGVPFPLYLPAFVAVAQAGSCRRIKTPESGADPHKPRTSVNTGIRGWEEGKLPLK